jgi:hypothetical protein
MDSALQRIIRLSMATNAPRFMPSVYFWLSTDANSEPGKWTPFKL